MCSYRNAWLLEPRLDACKDNKNKKSRLLTSIVFVIMRRILENTKLSEIVLLYFFLWPFHFQVFIFLVEDFKEFRPKQKKNEILSPFPIQGVSHWRVKSSGVGQSKIYKCPERSFGSEGVNLKQNKKLCKGRRQEDMTILCKRTYDKSEFREPDNLYKSTWLQNFVDWEQRAILI